MPCATTVLIPAKNESVTIAEVVRGAVEQADEILVIDGSSRDGTAQVATEAGARVVSDPGLGKGLAIRLAIEHLHTEYTVLMDADCSHDPKDIPKLVEPLVRDEADHVSASRLLGGSSELHGSFDEWARLAGSSFITACINWRYGVKLSEIAARPGYRLTVDLNECTVADDTQVLFRFEIDPARRHSLLNGLDDIAMTLEHEAKISAFEAARAG